MYLRVHQGYMTSFIFIEVIYGNLLESRVHIHRCL
nr:MAG TPA: hypothetical protein [Caudoviricetes sp.]